MEFFNKQIDGSWTIDRDIDFHGLITGDLTVPAGRSLKMHGTVSGNLVVEPNGQAHIAGTVDGDVVNRGGRVTVEGTIGGYSDLYPATPTLIAKNAVVRRK